MKTYKIEFTKSASKELKKLPKNVNIRILQSIDKLSLNPKQRSVRPMVDTTAWRLRVGDCKVIYDIHSSKLKIIVIQVRHGKDTYKK